MTSKILLFFPTYNVENAIAPVISSLSKNILSQLAGIYFIDNNSSDNTLKRIILSIKDLDSPNIRIYKNNDNYSLGGSTIIALRLAIEEKFDWLVCMHSDGQAKAIDLQQILNQISADSTLDIITGSRFLKSSHIQEYSKLRWLGNYFFCYIQMIILKQRIYDIGAFLAFNLKPLSLFPFEKIPTDMAYHPLLVLQWSKFKKGKLRIKEIPIEWGRVESSSVAIFTYGLKHLMRLLKLIGGGTIFTTQVRDLSTRRIH